MLLHGSGTTVRVLSAPGHTAGHVALEVASEAGDGALLVGDAIHLPLQMSHPELVQVGDADPKVAARTRALLLQRAAERGWPVLTAHFPAGSPERVTVSDEGHLAWAVIRAD